MKKTVIALALAVTLTGCGGLGVVSTVADMVLPSSEPAGIEVGAQIGEEANQQVILGDQKKTEVEVDAENATVNTIQEEKSQVTEVVGNVAEFIVNNQQAVPPWIWVLCILGWVLPTPTTMASWFRKPAS